MKVYEILSLAPEMLKTLHDCGIKPDDYKYINMYHEYTQIKKQGNKTTYAVAVLSTRYGICERKVYQILRRMKQDCKTDAV